MVRGEPVALELSKLAAHHPLRANFHEKAGECQGFLSFCLSSFLFSSFSKLFPLNQAALVATLPSALFVERLSLGASWVYSIQ
jgi:hypothetical protein